MLCRIEMITWSGWGSDVMGSPSIKFAIVNMLDLHSVGPQVAGFSNKERDNG